jgi:hypothetical protein
LVGLVAIVAKTIHEVFASLMFESDEVLGFGHGLEVVPLS